MFLGIVLLTVTRPDPGLAGPNSGGVLILHAPPGLQFTYGQDWSGYSNLNNCQDAITQVSGNGQWTLFYVLAIFPDYAMPRLQAVDFGIQYDSPQIEPKAWGMCTGTYGFENPSTGWPASGTGDQVVWPAGSPARRAINEVYWFASYIYEGNVFKLTTNYQWNEAKFVDDSLPPQLDDVEDFGSLGFGRRGSNPCGSDDPTGGCCTSNGQCIIQTRTACGEMGAGYTYLGDDTTCFPNNCIPGMGACCILTDCRLLTYDDCISAAGTFMGQGEGCNPTPCNMTQVRTSWGALKSIYRQ